MTHAITHEESLIAFNKQIAFVLETYTNHGLNIYNYNNIVLGGLGGSGIGSKIVADFFFDKMQIPTMLVGDYNLPAFANNKTLVILGSYSGNTEETLTMLSQAQQNNCTILTITAGGKLKEISEQLGYKSYKIETGFQPRMTLGYSLTTLFLIFGELVNIDFRPDLNNVFEELSKVTHFKNEAQNMLNTFLPTLNNKFVTICDANTTATSIRFCQQLQENSKAEGFISVLPEANHNMIETYYGIQPTNFIMLQSKLNNRVALRFGFIKDLLTRNGNNVYDLSPKAWNVVELYKSIYIMDWFTVLLSDARKQNNMEIANIIDLKNFLSN